MVQQVLSASWRLRLGHAVLASLEGRRGRLSTLPVKSAVSLGKTLGISHSFLNATAGSNRAARRAGIQVADSAIPARTAARARYVTGSVARNP